MKDIDRKKQRIHKMFEEIHNCGFSRACKRRNSIVFFSQMATFINFPDFQDVSKVDSTYQTPEEMQYKNCLTDCTEKYYTYLASYSRLEKAMQRMIVGLDKAQSYCNTTQCMEEIQSIRTAFVPRALIVAKVSSLFWMLFRIFSFLPIWFGFRYVWKF